MIMFISFAATAFCMTYKQEEKFRQELMELSDDSLLRSIRYIDNNTVSAITQLIDDGIPIGELPQILYLIKNEYNRRFDPDKYTPSRKDLMEELKDMISQ